MGNLEQIRGLIYEGLFTRALALASEPVSLAYVVAHATLISQHAGTGGGAMDDEASLWSPGMGGGWGMGGATNWDIECGGGYRDNPDCGGPGNGCGDDDGCGNGLGDHFERDCLIRSLDGGYERRADGVLKTVRRSEGRAERAEGWEAI